MGKSKLVEIADVERKALLKGSIYKEVDEVYSVTHPNAMFNEHGVDDPLNVKGRGTGSYLDSNKGGGSVDVSSRIENTKINKYNKDNEYKNPEGGE